MTLRLINSSRHKYWSCSKFADWLLKKTIGKSKPVAATMEEWDDWHSLLKNKNAFVAWIIMDGLDSLQNIVNFPSDLIHAVQYYIKNRFFDKLHYLPTRLKPGQYADTRERMLHGMFETLVDFVEIEKAHMQLCWGEEKVERPLRYKFPLLRWTSYRSRELGMKYLNWEASLDSNDRDIEERCPPQAATAREIIALYTWWKDIRPTRPDPMDASGWSAFCKARRDAGDDSLYSTNMTAEQREEQGRLLDLTNEIEKAQDQEDEDMLIRLIKIRLNLWT